jgi:hypothetical protein
VEHVVKVFPAVQQQLVVRIVQQQVVAELRQQVMVLQDQVSVVPVELE